MKNKEIRQSTAPILQQNTIERWTKDCILHFPKKGDLRIPMNYQGISFTSIMAKIYNALLLNFKAEIEKILRKNQNGFLRNDSTKSDSNNTLNYSFFMQITSRQHLLVDFSKAFDSIHRGKMEQILLAYGHIYQPLHSGRI